MGPQDTEQQRHRLAQRSTFSVACNPQTPAAHEYLAKIVDTHDIGE